jgi:hypothetical protein
VESNEPIGTIVARKMGPQDVSVRDTESYRCVVRVRAADGEACTIRLRSDLEGRFSDQPATISGDKNRTSVSPIPSSGGPK